MRLATITPVSVSTSISATAAPHDDSWVPPATPRPFTTRAFERFAESQTTGMLVQAASRMLKEEVTFSRTNVTSVDWVSYPILRCSEAPEVFPVVVKRQDQPSTGVGEEVIAAAAAAIANAFFDATGVRLREHPMTPPRVVAALRRG